MSVESLESLKRLVVEPMHAEQGFNTLLIVETNKHVNIRCLKKCLFYVQYLWEYDKNGNKCLEYKRTIFQGHSFNEHL
jgi:hypothetical protein